MLRWKCNRFSFRAVSFAKLNVSFTWTRTELWTISQSAVVISTACDLRSKKNPPRWTWRSLKFAREKMYTFWFPTEGESRFARGHNIPCGRVQPADIGLPTGNGKKLSCSQAQVGQATCLAVALFLSISCGPSYVRRLYTPHPISGKEEMNEAEGVSGLLKSVLICTSRLKLNNWTHYMYC